MSSRLSVSRGFALGAACVAAALSIFIATFTNSSAPVPGLGAVTTTEVTTTEVTTTEVTTTEVTNGVTVPVTP